MLGEYIKQSGQTQSHWAERFGVSSSYLSMLVRGRKVPSLQLAALIERQTAGAVPAVSWVSVRRSTPEMADTPEGSGQ